MPLKMEVRSKLVTLAYRVIAEMPDLPEKLSEKEILLALSVAAALEADKAKGPIKVPLPRKHDLPAFLRWHKLPDD